MIFLTRISRYEYIFISTLNHKRTRRNMGKLLYNFEVKTAISNSDSKFRNRGSKRLINQTKFR